MQGFQGWGFKIWGQNQGFKSNGEEKEFKTVSLEIQFLLDIAYRRKETLTPKA